MIVAAAATLEGVVQIEVVARFMREGAVARARRGANVAEVVMANDDAILGAREVDLREGCIAENGAAGNADVDGADDPNVQVFAVVPADDALDAIVRADGLWGLRAGDAVGAVALRVLLGQTEFDLHIGSHIAKHRTEIACVRILASEVLVEDGHGRLDLRIADVVAQVSIHDVEDHWDDVKGGFRLVA